MRTRHLVRSLAAAAAGCAALGAAVSAQAAPLPPAQAAQIEAITSGPGYPNATWGIAVTDAATGELVYGKTFVIEPGVNICCGFFPYTSSPVAASVTEMPQVAFG